MRSKISIRRKGDSVYLKFMGNFNLTSSEAILHALKKMVLSSLEFSNPASEVCFTFKTHARVIIDRELERIGLTGHELKSPALAVGDLRNL
jgi:hypothetical protein